MVAANLESETRREQKVGRQSISLAWQAYQDQSDCQQNEIGAVAQQYGYVETCTYLKGPLIYIRRDSL